MQKQELNLKMAQLLGATLYSETDDLLYAGDIAEKDEDCTAKQSLLEWQTALRTKQGELSWYKISTDTRTLQEGDLFVAFVGAYFDGHDYLLQAAHKGAAAAVVARSRWAKHRTSWREQGLNIPLFVVEETLASYQALAAFYRACFLPCLVAITGSVGKTSTREMISCALAPCASVHRTQENLNNEIGVPKTVLSSPENTDIAVIEMGMDRPGDIRLLSKMTKPDFAVITGIGFSHLEFFGTQEAILRAKAEIVEGLQEDGYLLLHARDPYLLQLADELHDNAPERKLAFVYACEEGERFNLRLPGRCFVAENIHSDDFGLYRYDLFIYEQQDKIAAAESQVRKTCLAKEIVIPVAGKHHIVNSLYGLLTAYLLNFPLEKAVSGLRDFTVVGNRQRMLEIAGMTVMNDSYNAAPESMLAALRTLALMADKQKRRSVAILGCIAELGAQAAQLHRELGRAVSALGIDCFYICGDFAAAFAEGIHEMNTQAQVQVFHDRDTLGDFVLPRLTKNDIILIKGSRSYKMEHICDRLIAEKMEK